MIDPTDRTELLAIVERLIIEIAGDEITLAGPITLATSFNGDLELETEGGRHLFTLHGPEPGVALLRAASRQIDATELEVR